MFEELINRYRGSGILLDSNVLLLYCIGRFDRARISAFKRTAKYSVEDYDRLARLVSLFPRIATLPHVLAEVNSLSSLAPGTLVQQYRSQFAEVISELLEEPVSSERASIRSEFSYLGLTDSAVLVAAANRFLIVTDDLKLWAASQRAGIDSLNFTNLAFH